MERTKAKIEKNIVDGIKENILEVILRHLPGDDAVIFLFGSWVNGQARKGSDIDIGLYFAKEMNRIDLAVLKDAVNEKAASLRKLEIIDFTAIGDESFLKEALKEIEIWHEKGESKQLFHNLRKRINV